jgi:hypothetical protein
MEKLLILKGILILAGKVQETSLAALIVEQQLLVLIVFTL